MTWPHLGHLVQAGRTDCGTLCALLPAGGAMTAHGEHGTMLKALWKRIAPWLPWAGVLVLLALLIQAVQPAALVAALRHANLWLLPPVVGSVLAALVLRGIRWHLLLKPIAAPNTLWDSLILFTAAQAALMIPGGPGGQFLLPVLQRS